MGLLKHESGIKKPGMDKIIKVPNKVLPKRLVDDGDSKSSNKKR